jgi:hypothetical protein
MALAASDLSPRIARVRVALCVVTVSAAMLATGGCGGSDQKPADNNAAGATALCNDGTLSYSQHHQGTCSWHGGVARWYH